MTVADADGGAVPAADEPVVFTATLAPPTGEPAPTGSVVFTLSAAGSGTQTTVCTTTVQDGQASCPVAFPADGAYDVAAFYDPGSGPGGNATYVPSQGYEQVTVGASPTA